jgi:hypothetical protein
MTPGQSRFGMPSPSTIGAYAPAVGSVVGAIIDSNSQAHANQSTAQSVREQMQFQAEQSSTQYQRAVKDMEAAGLNPALAYQQGGDSAASGGSYEAKPTMTDTGSKLATAVGAFTQLANGSAQRQLIRAQTDKTEADTGLSQIQQKNPEYALWAPDGGGVAGYRAAKQAALLAQAKRDAAEAGNYPTQFKANLRNLNQLTDTSAQSARESRARATLMEQQFTNEWFRKNVAPYLNSTASTIKAFTPAMSFVP